MLLARYPLRHKALRLIQLIVLTVFDLALLHRKQTSIPFANHN